MCGFTRCDAVWNEVIKDMVGVIVVEDRMRETRFRWFRYVLGRDTNDTSRRCERLEIDAFNRRRGRLKKYWTEVIMQDLKKLQLTEYLNLDRKV